MDVPPSLDPHLLSLPLISTPLFYLSIPFWLLHCIIFINPSTKKFVFIGLLDNLLQFQFNHLHLFTQTQFQALVNFVFILAFLRIQPPSAFLTALHFLAQLLAILYCILQEYVLIYFTTTLLFGFLIFSPFSPLYPQSSLLFFPTPFSHLFPSYSGLSIPSSHTSSQQPTTPNHDSLSNHKVDRMNGIFDLSHTLINLDPYSNMYGNLGLWVRPSEFITQHARCDYQLSDQLKGGLNSALSSLPRASTSNPPACSNPSQTSPRKTNSGTNQLPTHYLYWISIECWIKQRELLAHPTLAQACKDTLQQTYFAASRRFSLLSYFFAKLLPPTLSVDITFDGLEDVLKMATDQNKRPVGNLWRKLDTMSCSPPDTGATNIKETSSTKPHQNQSCGTREHLQTHKVLDVGFGCGDQIFTLLELWADHLNPTPAASHHNNHSNRTKATPSNPPSIPAKRPLTLDITGVNLSHQQTAMAKQRYLQRFQSTREDHTISHNESFSVSFYQGSGTELLHNLDNNTDSTNNQTARITNTNTPPNLQPDSFTTITVLDSIYHFNTKLSFFQQASSLLQVGGTLVCTDIVVNELDCLICQQILSNNVRSSHTNTSSTPTTSNPSSPLNNPIQSAHQLHDHSNRTNPSVHLSRPLTFSDYVHCAYQGHGPMGLPLISEKMFSIPATNLWNLGEYDEFLTALSFCNIKIIPVGQLLYEGFHDFLNTIMPLFPNQLISAPKWLKFVLTGYALKHWAPKIFDYCIIVAEKGEKCKIA